MNLLNWVNVIDKKMAVLSVEANLCTKLISPKSTCTSCVDHCPKTSISFANKDILIADSCVDCGICGAVCPTGAITMNKPPLTQFVQEAIHKSERHEKVYLHCDRTPISKGHATTVAVPCLGMIPKEAWVTILNKCKNLSIYQPEQACTDCEISTGEKLWRRELQAGETISCQKMKITSEISHSKESVDYNVERRDFLSAFFKETKSTNKLAIKEMLGGSAKIPTYQEKRQGDSLSKLKKEWNDVGSHLIERMTNESVYPYMNKQSLFLKELQENEAMWYQEDIRLPQINEDCHFCGACAILCPTEALTMKNERGQQKITLQPYKCVDCSLCAEICYTKNIQLQQAKNQTLLENEITLVEKHGQGL
ncbi:4Fe-4S binding protein [Neobacillus sp. YIM B06451]|uniref:4Fe-4S binding protein n=1 Tax=Neobacillus sp. YIM B06451 TaxID=3070994 RepID=UPI002930779F|nr:4Fe-4S dicluster domain-containing protein [Neobacillus sp. YIM B06451]